MVSESRLAFGCVLVLCLLGMLLPLSSLRQLSCQAEQCHLEIWRWGRTSMQNFDLKQATSIQSRIRMSFEGGSYDYVGVRLRESEHELKVFIGSQKSVAQVTQELQAIQSTSFGNVLRWRSEPVLIWRILGALVAGVSLGLLWAPVVFKLRPRQISLDYQIWLFQGQVLIAVSSLVGVVLAWFCTQQMMRLLFRVIFTSM